ncbi:unnamed protein product [Didymodactylos carnosus]|uniref:Uncharacterized protein n=1 Tax=Didymodactylos carnosus TaxID=1234261 RepID=A0A814TJT7_9BILA|nr:unnamed protein product [Didymodactylos carnosus]CAF1163018.1 unnamed protein product [Didymodactylos carnosus]CAF3623432.1 unnamed protein product [Didymodactylos carnosus]CAF3926572.1 unnamed protein product [Didymodactylos carnosus]
MTNTTISEDFLKHFVWFNLQNHRTESTLLRLNRLFNNLKIFDNIDECSKHVQSSTNQFVAIISSDNYHVVDKMSRMDNIDSIYLLRKIDENKNWNNSKIYGIYYSENTLLRALANRFNTDHIPVSTFNLNNIPKQTSIRNLNKNSGTFLWHQLLMEIILRLPSQTERAKEDMIEVCRQYYETDRVQLKNIDEFEKSYNANSVIQWYTTDTFFYRLLNKAFRSQNIDIIFKFRKFISDLHHQITQGKQVNNPPRVVYRGQTLSQTEIELIQNSKDDLISMNSFLSTTIDRNLALIFAGNTQESVLFEIWIDDVLETVPFTTLKDSGEDEILFSFGTVCRILFVEKSLNENVWIIKLKLSCEENNELKRLRDHYKNELDKTTDLFDLGLCLWEMGDNDRALNYYELINKDLPDNHEAKGQLFNVIGIAYNNKNMFDLALKNYELALHFYNQNGYRYVKIFQIYSNIGSVYEDMGKYKEALQNYREAEHHDHHILVPSRKSLKLKANIANVYTVLGQYKEAISLHENLIKLLEQQQSPTLHPIRIIVYNNFGYAYSQIGESSQALEYYEKAIKILEQIHHPDHILLARAYNNLGHAYLDQKLFSAALQNFQKALKIQKLDELELAKIYNNIGEYHNIKEEYSDALKYHEKVLEIRKRLLSPLNKNYPYIAITLNNIGTIYFANYVPDKAMQYFQQALEIESATLPVDHPSLAITYNNIGAVYERWHSSKALEYYRMACEIAGTNLHPNNVYHNIYETNLKRANELDLK